MCITPPTTQGGTFVAKDESTWTHHSFFTLGFTLGVVHSPGLAKCVMAFLSIIIILYRVFLLPKNPLFSATASPAQAITELFTISIILSFPECHIVEITELIAFSDWFLSLSNMHLNLLHVL